MRYLLPLLTILSVGCTETDVSGLFTRMDVRVVDNEATVAQEFLSVVETAEDELYVAIPHAQDTELCLLYTSDAADE